MTNQPLINRMSLVMTISEDIVKAARANNLSPALTEVLMRLHNQNLEMDKAINELRSVQLQMAKVIETSVDLQTNFAEEIKEMSKKIGFSPDEIVSSDKFGQH